MITEELIDRLVTATNEAKETIREAHEARADLRAAIRDAHEAVAGIREVVRDAAGEVLVAQAGELLDRVGVEKAAAALRRQVRRWDELLARAQQVLSGLEARANRL